MEQTIINGVEVDKVVKLGDMRQYLLEWYTDGIFENITKFDEIYFEDYDRFMEVKDAKTEKTIFNAVFHRNQPIDDESKVYLSGVVDEELRGIIGKIIELDRQSTAYNVKNQNQTQKGE